MDKQQIIESGLLELYALGEADRDEMSSVEQLLNDADVQNSLRTIEVRLEQTGLENAVTPPAWVKEKLFEEIKPAGKTTAPTISIVEKQIEKWRRNFMIAASFAGLLALGLAWQLMSKSGTDTELQARLTSLENEIQKLSESNSSINGQLAYINHTYTTPIVLRKTANAPEDTKAVVYWNPKVDEALLSTNAMPELPEGKVYQIWADIDGKMVSLKVFSVDEKLVKVPYTPQAESLNVTVEPKGGSEHPTVEELMWNAPTEL